MLKYLNRLFGIKWKQSSRTNSDIFNKKEAEMMGNFNKRELRCHLQNGGEDEKCGFMLLYSPVVSTLTL